MGKLEGAVSVAGGGTNQVSAITVTGGPTGGTFTVTVGGQTTAGQAYNVSAATLESALEGLSTVASVTVARSGAGSAGDPYVWSVTFDGTDAATAFTVSADGSSLTGGATPDAGVSTTTAAVALAAADIDVRDTDIVSVELVYDADAAGSVVLKGTLTGDGYDTLATDTAAASTTAIVHIVDMPVKTLRIDPTGLTAGTVDISLAKWRS